MPIKRHPILEAKTLKIIHTCFLVHKSDFQYNQSSSVRVFFFWHFYRSKISRVLQLIQWNRFVYLFSSKIRIQLRYHRLRRKSLFSKKTPIDPIHAGSILLPPSMCDNKGDIQPMKINQTAGSLRTCSLTGMRHYLKF